MEFHQIRYFLATADHMNFTRAAEACAVSQPALTVAIRKLEEELGGPLFHRDARGTSLTELGRTMRTHLARIEETRLLAGRAAQAALAEGGPLDVGVYATIVPDLLAPALEEFGAQVPEADLVLYDVWGARTYDLLLSGAFDCAIVARHATLPARVKSVPLMSEPMVLAAADSHAFAGRNSVRLSDLADAVYFDRLRCEFREPIHEILRNQGIAPRTRLRSESDAYILRAVAEGAGVTIGPCSVLSVPGVVTLPIEDTEFIRCIELVTVEGRTLSPTGQRFVDFIAGYDWSQSMPYAKTVLAS